MAGGSRVRERLRRAGIRLLGRAHVLLYRVGRGRLLGRLAGMPVVLLTTTGRRSGRRRTVALTAIEHGDELLLVGSFGGSDAPPAWFLNLRADPRVVVQRGRARWTATAHVATGAERTELWPVVVAAHEGYARYQARTTREIPIVLLARAGRARGIGTSPDGGADPIS